MGGDFAVTTKTNTWVILLRGINVGGVKVPMADLKKMLEGLGMRNVKTLLASGNVIVDAEIADPVEVKRVVEAALATTFGRPLSVIVRSHADIQKMVAEHPFSGIKVTEQTRLNVTFLGAKVKEGVPVPFSSEDGSFSILAMEQGALFSVLDLAKSGTVDAMAIIEKAWGKDVTTRNWNTVEKIAAAR
jgi:uncharacterized protein (DUF1697 family)